MADVFRYHVESNVSLFFIVKIAPPLKGLREEKKKSLFCFWFFFSFLNEMQSAFLKCLQSVLFLKPFQRDKMGFQKVWVPPLLHGSRSCAIKYQDQRHCKRDLLL